MTEGEARAEINLRLERETRYILAKIGSNDLDKAMLDIQLKENDITIRLLGEWLGEGGDNWEKFYKERFWDKKQPS